MKNPTDHQIIATNSKCSRQFCTYLSQNLRSQGMTLIRRKKLICRHVNQMKIYIFAKKVGKNTKSIRSMANNSSATSISLPVMLILVKHGPQSWLNGMKGTTFSLNSLWFLVWFSKMEEACTDRRSMNFFLCWAMDTSCQLVNEFSEMLCCGCWHSLAPCSLFGVLCVWSVCVSFASSCHIADYWTLA